MKQPRIASFRRLTLAGALAAAFFLAAPISAATETGLRVSFLVFSGRPNPTLTVSDAKQVLEIESRLAATLARDSRPDVRPPQPVLGYNGILVERLGVDGPPAAFVVQGDQLRPESDSEKATPRVSISREALEIEGILLDLGKKSGALDETALAVIRGGR